MKIAHILGSLGMGGAERVALDLATVQKQLCHEVVVISLSESHGGPLAQEFDVAAIPVYRVPKKPGLDWTLPPRIARVLGRLQVDVVHTHNTQPLVYAAAASRLSGMAVIHTKHGEGHLISKAGKVLRRLGSPFVHSFVAVSEKTAEDARAQWAYPGRIKVIPNGIRLDKHRPDPEARAAIRCELGISDEAWVIGSIGRFDDNKNQSLLVRSVSAMLGSDVHLVLVGEGPAMNTVRTAASACARPESVHFLGRRSDASQILAALDVFALPSLSEGLPLVILEAMATGLPIVSTAVGGIPKVIEDGRTGFLVPAGDEAAMSKRLADVAGNREFAAVMGDAARMLAIQSYSAEGMSNAYLDLYRRALRRSWPMGKALRGASRIH